MKVGDYLPPRAFGRQRPRGDRRREAAALEDEDEASRDAARRVTLPRGMTTVEFVEVFPDKYARFIVFEDERGRGRCWRLGAQSADAFIAAQSGLRFLHEPIFHTPKVRVFFPIVPALMPAEARRAAPGFYDDDDDDGKRDSPYFAARSISIRGAPTLARILRAVETVAAQSIALHLDADLGRPGATYGDARRCLKDYVVCWLLCRLVGGGNHVYVRLA